MNKTRQKIHDVIYEADTPAGKIFDISLIIVIIISVVLVALETVGWINEKYYNILNIAEWIITILFTIEYILRVVSIHVLEEREWQISALKTFKYTVRRPIDRPVDRYSF